jgi:acyl carrier protein
MLSERLIKTLLRELSLEDYPLAESTVASEVPGWDSLSHVRILVAVEKEFGVRFKSLEVIRLKNLGDLQVLVDKKLMAQRRS